jgi:hypothetical protein
MSVSPWARAVAAAAQHASEQSDKTDQELATARAEARDKVARCTLKPPLKPVLKAPGFSALETEI